MGKILNIVFACALVATVAGCNTSGCLDNGSAIPLAGFYSSSTGSSISLDSLDIHGVGAPGDSLVLSAGKSASSVYLPMRSTATTTAWTIAYAYKGLDHPAYNDTLTFSYESIPYFASEECGAMYCYRVLNLRHTNHLIDSVIMTDSLITNVDLETIRIYFRTTTGEGGEQ